MHLDCMTSLQVIQDTYLHAESICKLQQPLHDASGSWSLLRKQVDPQPIIGTDCCMSLVYTRLARVRCMAWYATYKCMHRKQLDNKLEATLMVLKL